MSAHHQPKLRRTFSGTRISRVFLPDELIMEVLSFLSVKYLMRFKCVCKSWKTIISDPTFVKLHLKISARNKHLALFSILFRHSSYFSIAGFSLCRLLKNKSINLANKPNFRLKDVYGFLYPVGSCNGLLCLFGYFSINNYEETLLYLWNPATRTLSDKILFLRQYEVNFKRYWKFAFGYDNSVD